MALKKKIVLIVFFLIGGVLIFRLGYFQVREGAYWQAMARGQHNVFIEGEGLRGSIYMRDKNGQPYPLAINAIRYEVFLSPGEVEDKQAVIDLITSELSIDCSSRLEKDNSLYEKIKGGLTEDEVKNIRDANLKGVHVKGAAVRWYPQGEIGSHLSGFVGGEGSGQYGLEGFYNHILQGEKVIQKGERWRTGLFITSGIARPGQDIYTTIDYNIQFMAEKLLDEAIESLKAKGGTIIVGDPFTGRLLAVVSRPHFNPNSYGQSAISSFRNIAVQRVFEPGSIFKPITMAAALEEGVITPESTYTDTGTVRIGGRTISNYNKRTFGQVDMKKVLGQSINTGLVYVESLIGHDRFLSYIEKFGFLDRTGVDLQGEEFSRNVEFLKGYEINFATASFGQGINVNLMQMFRSFSALANGGYLVNPWLVTEKEIGERVISEKTSQTITSIMVGTTEEGYSKNARVPGYLVAGKTGTAQVPWSFLGINKAGYSDETIQSFIGYAPAYSPRFLIIVTLDNPQTNTAEYSAAPVFSNLSKYILNYYQIPPDL